MIFKKKEVLEHGKLNIVKQAGTWGRLRKGLQIQMTDGLTD